MRQHAEDTYQDYIKDLSYTRVALQPNQKLDRTPIERIIENRIRTLLVNAVPQMAIQQCMFQQDLTCAQVLYRTMVFSGLASKDDRKKMHELLTQPRVIEVRKFMIN